MVKFTAVVVIEGKGAIGMGFQVISSNVLTWMALLKDRDESAIVVAYNPYRPRSRAIEHKMIRFSAVVVVESEGEISGGFKVVSGNAAARITLFVDRRENIGWSARVEL